MRPDTTTDEPVVAAGNGVSPPLDAAAPAAGSVAAAPIEPDDAHFDAVAAAAHRAVAAAAAARRAPAAPRGEEAARAEPPGEDAAPAEPIAQTLAAFYDRRAPAALAYCARICEPETIADAVEEAFGHVFASAAGGEALSEDQLDELLRAAVHEAVADRAPDDPETAGRLLAEAERAYEALSGDDAPALGRSLLGEMLAAAAPPAAAEVAAEDAPVVEERAPQAPQPRRRLTPGWRRRLVIFLAVAGTLLLAEAVVTLVWKEPFTGYLAAQAQDDLGKQLANRSVSLSAADQRSLAAIGDATARSRRRMALLATHLDANVTEGEALGRIQIGKIGIDYVFVQGTDAASLRKGPGHYQGVTKLPGQGGVVGIAGHRTTYEAPFREIDSLGAGDHITLRMPYGRFTYEVTGHRIVP
ncbi:MAG: sortase, partial [Thermoleophilaceae bacterium]|nr:sortase [Thermoleophilaceae bacterium]